MSLLNKIKAFGKGRDPGQDGGAPGSAFGTMEARLAMAGADGV